MIFKKSKGLFLVIAFPAFYKWCMMPAGPVDNIRSGRWFMATITPGDVPRKTESSPFSLFAFGRNVCPVSPRPRNWKREEKKEKCRIIQRMSPWCSLYVHRETKNIRNEPRRHCSDGRRTRRSAVLGLGTNWIYNFHSIVGRVPHVDRQGTVIPTSQAQDA